MNSIAQHAVPNGSGQSELPRAQSTTFSSFVVRYVAPARSSSSRSDSPGSVMSPFSAPSPGATPALRGMIDAGFSIFWMGMTYVCSGRILMQSPEHREIVKADEAEGNVPLQLEPSRPVRAQIADVVKRGVLVEFSRAGDERESFVVKLRVANVKMLR